MGADCVPNTESTRPVWFISQISDEEVELRQHFSGRPEGDGVL